MIGVSDVLKKNIIELQNLESISKFALGGGTNLSLVVKFHNIVDDISSPSGFSLKA